MKVSTRGDYASRALLSLALHAGQTVPTSVRDIAERTGLPQPYLEQILLALKGAGLVRSKRGVGGGYVLARGAEDITLGQIVSAVDGPIQAGDFGEPHQNGACDHEGQCILLSVWAEVGQHMRRHLDSFTLADMVAQALGGGPATSEAELAEADAEAEAGAGAAGAGAGAAGAGAGAAGAGAGAAGAGAGAAGAGAGAAGAGAGAAGAGAGVAGAAGAGAGVTGAVGASPIQPALA